MSDVREATLVTSDEFVIDLLSELSLRGVEELKLAETLEDTQFAEAFEALLNKRDDLGIAVDFSLATNPYHGDSSTLREALYALRERGVVTINNPRFKTVEIKLSKDDAEFYLSHSILGRPFVAGLVDAYFQHATQSGQHDAIERVAEAP